MSSYHGNSLHACSACSVLLRCKSISRAAGVLDGGPPLITWPNNAFWSGQRAAAVLGPLGPQGFFAVAFPADNHLGTMRRRRMGRGHGRDPGLPGNLSGQDPGVGPKIHVLLYWQQHVDALLSFATGDARTIDKTAIQDEQLDHAPANVADQVFHQLIKDRVHMGVAWHDRGPGIDERVPSPMQEADQFVATLPVRLVALWQRELPIVRRMVVLIKPHHHRALRSKTEQVPGSCVALLTAFSCCQRRAILYVQPRLEYVLWKRKLISD
jgi:hypothetical protein